MSRAVEVRNRFDGGWSGGYVVEEIVTSASREHYRLRRCSDGWVLPRLFPPEDVRPCDATFVVDWEIAGAS